MEDRVSLHPLRKQFFYMITPLFLKIRNTLLRWGWIKHTGRQPYLIGKIPASFQYERNGKLHITNHTSILVICRLVQCGFTNNYLAWVEDDEIASLRLLLLDTQYHIRIYSDGEVRGHYELAPEYHPMKHITHMNTPIPLKCILDWLEGWVDIDYEYLAKEIYES